MTRRSVGGLSFLVSLIGALTMSSIARAQPGGDEDLPAVQLSGAGVALLKLAVPRAEGDADGAATEMLSKDMDITGLFQILDPASFPAQLQSEGMNFSSALWTQVGAQAVVKMKVAGSALDGRVYVVARGDTAVASKSYRAADLRDAVHEFANDVVKAFTGQPGVFGSRIALAMSGRGPHEIAVVDMDGARTSVVTKMGSDSLLPAFAPSGAEIAFTSYLRNNPDLWIVSAGGGRARRVSKEPGLNTGAAWSRSGALALTMSYEGNSEIYRIDPNDGRIEARLTNNPAIDSSPCFSPDGSQIAFVSNRQGSPQIFVMSANGGGAKRVTFQGKYNQTPRWSPRADKPQIAFTGRDERGVFDLFLLDVRTGKVDRLTQGHGSNLDPTWSPDGRLLAYVSTRGGLFVQNPETHHEVQVWKGTASSPSWGPAPRH
ncbi:MAG TPA: translocation protein TolB [Polyangia bacterium]|nr:translocation protein TolB [Polyangia bacterium]